jgi:hypothetical protein
MATTTALPLEIYSRRNSYDIANKNKNNNIKENEKYTKLTDKEYKTQKVTRLEHNNKIEEISQPNQTRYFKQDSTSSNQSDDYIVTKL